MPAMDQDQDQQIYSNHRYKSLIPDQNRRAMSYEVAFLRLCCYLFHSSLMARRCPGSRPSWDPAQAVPQCPSAHNEHPRGSLPKFAWKNLQSPIGLANFSLDSKCWAGFCSSDSSPTCKLLRVKMDGSENH